MENPRWQWVGARLIAIVLGILLWSGVTTAGYKAIAAEKAPDDLQSFFQQAADRLDLPLFPFAEPAPETNDDFDELDLQDQPYTPPTQQAPEPQAPQTPGQSAFQRNLLTNPEKST